ncbi:outer membrane protein transport protein [Flavobacteriaceae bacterium F89]|uniref:Outer membrane protein transport protein n=1 Tax=Cerina litoralis TaxID=2874477 RepID=A0AAE3JNC1_9FLAO|nr:outer membrane protein transport protein [Cerina litoralis]MCG2459721.1 outer membrane protein transport protein [Cerina litoralis]
MKKYTFTILFLFACVLATAQNINDVLRLSTENIQGTARYQGLSGAFGALGGDLSALNINPAGSAVFLNNQFTLTAANYNSANESSYFGQTNNSSLNTFRFNQGGGAFVFENSSGNNDWKRFTMAFNYDMVQNFNDALYISGPSDQGIDNYFLNYAEGVPFGNILLQDGEYIEDAYLDIGSSFGYSAQQAFLGYYGGIIDPLNASDDNGTDYISNASYIQVNQDYTQSTSGQNSKMTANFASQYKNFLYLGASMNFNSVVYNKITTLRESGFAPNSEISFTSFDNFLHTEGYGFSFSLGAIAKVNEFFRVGASYESPTWYDLKDETSQKINSDLADSDIGYINFDIVNVYNSYTIKTPGKVTGSMAVVFGKNGLLSLDYAFQDMSNAELRPNNDPSFASENEYISNQLGGVSSIRVGGEYRLGRVFSLRGGYRYEQSPFKNGITVGSLNGYSTGVGFNFGPSRLDVAFNQSFRDMDKYLYDTGFPTPAHINKKNTNVTFGYTINF